MKILSQINVQRDRGEALIQLLQGDLTAIPAEHAVDILAISAFPGSYVPVPKTLIAALYEKGINIDEMSRDKEIDLLPQLSCWLSKPLKKEQQDIFNFRRILCFEPNMRVQSPEKVVGNIFRCINSFAFSEQNNAIAMPVLASGNQKIPMEKMLPALLDAAIFWLQGGLPLMFIKLVVQTNEQAIAALAVFNWAKQQTELKNAVQQGKVTAAEALKFLEKNRSLQGTDENLKIVESEIKETASKEAEEKNGPSIVGEPQAHYPAAGGGESLKDDNYDFFISYAHKHAPLINSFVDMMKAKNARVNVFYDRDSIPPGGLWIKQISDAILKAKKVLIFLSPDYNNSPVCWDEFQCAKLIEYNNKKQIIQTVYLYNDTALPPIMGIYSWTDCREGDSEKLKELANKIV